MPAGQRLGSPIRATVLPVRPRPCWAGLCPGCGRIRLVRRRGRRAEVAALLGWEEGEGLLFHRLSRAGRTKCVHVCVCVHAHVCACVCTHVCACRGVCSTLVWLHVLFAQA